LFFCLKTGLKPNNLDILTEVAGSIKALHIGTTEHTRSIILADFLSTEGQNTTGSNQK